jgi:hypothetical protein
MNAAKTQEPEESGNAKSAESATQPDEIVAHLNLIWFVEILREY